MPGEIEGAENLDATSAVAEDATPIPADQGADEGAVPAGGAPESGAGPKARGANENAIPHWRVKEMLAARDREHSQRYSALEKKLKQYDDYSARQQEAQLAYLRQIGALPEEKPSFVPENVFNQRLQEQEQRFRSELEDRAMAEQARSEWREVAVQFPHYAKVRGFRDAVFADWVRQPFRPMSDIASEVAKDWDGLGTHFAERAAAAQKAEEAKRAGAAKVVKPGGGGGAPGKTPSEARKSVGDRIRDKLSE